MNALQQLSSGSLLIFAIGAEILGTALLDIASVRNDLRFIAPAIAFYAAASILFFYFVRAADGDFRTALSLVTVIVLASALMIDTALISRSIPTVTQTSGLLTAVAAVFLLTRV